LQVELLAWFGDHQKGTEVLSNHKKVDKPLKNSLSKVSYHTGLQKIVDVPAKPW
jgi:hypothetical protein